MPPVRGPPAGGAQVQGAGPPQQQQPNFLWNIGKYVLIYWVFTSFLAPKKPPNPAEVSQNLFKKGDELDMWVYLTENEVLDPRSDATLVWHEENIPYVTYAAEGERHLHHTYIPSEAAKNNGSLWAHVVFARSGHSPNAQDPSYDQKAAFGKSYPVVIYGPPPKKESLKNLLGKDLKPGDKVEGSEAEPFIKPSATEDDDDFESSEGGDQKPATKQPWVSYLRPNVTINLVDEFTKYPKGAVPAPVQPFIQFEYQSGDYYPPIYFNDFWLLKDHLILLNDTVQEVDMHFAVGPISQWKWQLYLQTGQSFQMQQQWGSMAEGESDDIKRVFLEGNPVLLGITMCVSLLHSVFDFLAFKNDITFWKNNKSMEGLSARSVVTNFVCQVIIFFYLLDNETSWMIIISCGVGCLIEFWKIGKAMDVSIDRSGSFPLLRFKDRESYSKNKTKEYDEQAQRYLSYALYPIVVGYGIYSLVYQTHKSWYSWLLTSLTGCVYTFGFITMTPQLFINYKMKSVAHLPWRQMTYKFLNTIIDDLFAFVIKMPWLHRLSVFRDDVVFLIYIYQRWIYPVDKKRVNEFGFGGEGPPEAESTVQLTGPQDGDVAVLKASGSDTGPIEGTDLTKTAAGKKADKTVEKEVASGSSKQAKVGGGTKKTK